MSISEEDDEVAATKSRRCDSRLSVMNGPGTAAATGPWNEVQSDSRNANPSRLISSRPANSIAAVQSAVPVHQEQSLRNETTSFTTLKLATEPSMTSLAASDFCARLALCASNASANVTP